LRSRTGPKPPTQLIKETRRKIAVEPGKPERVDYEYERNGTAANFVFTEPLGSWRRVNVRQRKTSIDWVYEIKELLNGDYSEAEKVILVCDNLNQEFASNLLCRILLCFFAKNSRNGLRKIIIRDKSHEFAAVSGNSMGRCCINRHAGYVGCSFMDFSARKVGLKELWTIKWHKSFNTSGPYTLAGGVQADDWPEWIRPFRDY